MASTPQTVYVILPSRSTLTTAHCATSWKLGGGKPDRRPCAATKSLQRHYELEGPWVWLAYREERCHFPSHIFAPCPLTFVRRVHSRTFEGGIGTPARASSQVGGWRVWRVLAGCVYSNRSRNGAGMQARDKHSSRSERPPWESHRVGRMRSRAPNAGYCRCHAPTRPLRSFWLINVFFVDHAKFQNNHALFLVLSGRGVTWSGLPAPYLKN